MNAPVYLVQPFDQNRGAPLHRSVPRAVHMAHHEADFEVACLAAGFRGAVADIGGATAEEGFKVGLLTVDAPETPISMIDRSSAARQSLSEASL